MSNEPDESLFAMRRAVSDLLNRAGRSKDGAWLKPFFEKAIAIGTREAMRDVLCYWASLPGVVKETIIGESHDPALHAKRTAEGGAR